MHEIRATIAPQGVDEAVRLARNAGIERVTVTDVYVHGPDVGRRTVSVETSTPKARDFVEAFLASPVLTAGDYALTSRELRAIVDRSDLADLTRPLGEPFPDVIQDLWQLSHVTPSYAGRAAAGGILLATGIMDDNAVAMVVAAMFLPFLAEILSVSLGLRAGDGRLVRRGLRALLVSIALAFAGGALVARAQGGPIRFTGFHSPLGSFAISAVIGITAGLSQTDDSGRRYLIGVAAAVHLAIFPVWFGAASVLGLPSADVLRPLLLSFLINLITVAISAAAAYAVLQGRGAPAAFRGNSG